MIPFRHVTSSPTHGPQATGSDLILGRPGRGQIRSANLPPTTPHRRFSAPTLRYLAAGPEPSSGGPACARW